MVWEEAVKYGFFCAQGGSWYTKTLFLLQPGSRLWVNVSAIGYVGVGEVLEEAVVVDDFMVTNDAGQQVRLIDLPVKAAGLNKAADDDKAAYLVRMKWLKTVPVSQAVREKGFFGNQNIVAKPRVSKWDLTIERLKQRFDIA